MSWDVRDPVDLAEIWEGPGQSRPLTAEEWEFKPHPSSSWIVLMKFDGRAIDSDDWSNGPEIQKKVLVCRRLEQFIQDLWVTIDPP